ncbi:MAG: tyrosine-type recombinase/integrase [Halanaeroarchaeum sp.]
MPTRDYRGGIEALRARVNNSEEISDEDAELLIEFSDRLDLLQSRIGDYRHKDLLGYCVRLAENVGGLADALEDREAAEELVRYINREYDNEETNRDYRDGLRQFGEHVTEGEGKPDSIDWIPSGYSRNYDPAPNPAHMLKWERDVLPMIESTRNSRDAAMIATAWNLGARPFEFQDITVGDVTDSQHGLQVTVHGKRGQRSPTLILAVPYLQRWLDDHPDRDDPDAPLWSKLTSPEGISDRMFRKILETAAERAEVTRPVTLSNFRKSCASYLASQNVNQPNIEDHMGWTRGSSIAARYVAVFGTENERQIAKAYGADVEESEPEPIAPVECVRCKRETPKDRDRCMWCGQLLTPEAIEKLQRDEGEVRRAVLDLVRDDPKVIDQIEKSERLMDVLADRPELEEEIVAMAEDLVAE